MNTPATPQAKARRKHIDRQRRKCRMIVQRVGLGQFLVAQDNKCSICQREFDVSDAKSIDHVHPIYHGGAMTAGNILIAHEKCNSRKGDAPAQPHELKMLRLVNKRLAYDPVFDTYAAAPTHKDYVTARLRTWLNTEVANRPRRKITLFEKVQLWLHRWTHYVII